MKKKLLLGMVIFFFSFSFLNFSPANAQPIENELYLITPVSKDVHDPALTQFAAYAKKKWNIDVKTSAIPKGTPVAYGQILEWKGRPQADVFWGGEGTLFDSLAAEGLLEPVKILPKMWDEIPATIGKPVGLPLKDPKKFWVGTTLEPPCPHTRQPVGPGKALSGAIVGRATAASGPGPGAGLEP